MNRRRITTGLGILVSGAWMALSSMAIAQTGAESIGETLQPGRNDWEQRVLRQGVGRPASYRVAQQPRTTAPRTLPDLSVPSSPAEAPLSMAAPEGMPYVPSAPEPYVEGGPGCEGGACGPEACGSCGDCYGDYSSDCCDLWAPRVGCWLRGFTLFTGFQGFKGPLDLGHNGNFGFHEGINFGAPLNECWGLGYQVGFQGVHSNLSGNQTVTDHGRRVYDTNNRDQIFLTGGVFWRAPEDGCWQGAVVFDYLHDNYYAKTDVSQIRNELSLRLDSCREIGYWGAYGVSSNEFSDGYHSIHTLKSTNLYAFFFRRHLSSGGQGRLWAGFTGNSDAYVGGDVTVPLGSNWALQTDFAYLIPTERGSAGQEEEGWNVLLRLVWYPGRPAACAIRAPYQPLMDVAHNGVFMVDFR